MSEKTNRTQLTDLSDAEQEMTRTEMEQVEGGTTTKETRSNPTIAPVDTSSAGSVVVVPQATLRKAGGPLQGSEYDPSKGHK